LTVEISDGAGNWDIVLTDSDWDTKFNWARPSNDIIEPWELDWSLITIEWQIGEATLPGTYRIQTFGSSKDILGSITPYTGTSSQFIVSS